MVESDQHPSHGPVKILFHLFHQSSFILHALHLHTSLSYTKVQAKAVLFCLSQRQVLDTEDFKVPERHLTSPEPDVQASVARLNLSDDKGSLVLVSADEQCFSLCRRSALNGARGNSIAGRRDPHQVTTGTRVQDLEVTVRVFPPTVTHVTDAVRRHHLTHNHTCVCVSECVSQQWKS